MKNAHVFHPVEETLKRVFSSYSDETLGTILVIGAVGLMVGCGLVLYGRRRCVQLVRDIVARIKLTFEMRRNPQLRMRFECLRKYETFVESSRPAFDGRYDGDGSVSLAALFIMRDFTDEEIGVIAEYLNVTLFNGHSDIGRIIEFLEDERRIATNQPLLVCGHVRRLDRLTQRLSESCDTSDTSA